MTICRDLFDSEPSALRHFEMLDLLKFKLPGLFSGRIYIQWIWEIKWILLYIELNAFVLNIEACKSWETFWFPFPCEARSWLLRVVGVCLQSPHPAGREHPLLVWRIRNPLRCRPGGNGLNQWISFLLISCCWSFIVSTSPLPDSDAGSAALDAEIAYWWRAAALQPPPGAWTDSRSRAAERPLIGAREQRASQIRFEITETRRRSWRRYVLIGEPTSGGGWRDEGSEETEADAAPSSARRRWNRVAGSCLDL